MPLRQVSRNPLPDPLLQPLLPQPRSLSHQQEQHHAFIRIRRPALPNTQALDHLARKPPLQHRVDIRAAEPDAARVQHAVGPPEDVDMPRRRVDRRKVALRPDVGEAREVGRAVLGSRRRGGVVPEEQRHVWECGCGYEVAGRAVWNRRDGRIAAVFA